MAILVCISIVAFLVFAAFAINVAYINASKAEFRSAVDAASRAATLELADFSSEAQVIDRAVQIAAMNKVAGSPLALTNNDVLLGKSQVNVGTGRFEFTAGIRPYNSVRVVGDRASTAALRTSTIFGGLVGSTTFGMQEISTSVRADRDIYVVIDRSGSMMRRIDDLILFPPGCDATTPPHPTLSRWSQMLASYSLFLSVLDSTPSNERVALVTYGSDSTTDVTLTDDYAASYNSLLWRSSQPIVGFTNLGQGVEDALFGLFYLPGVRSYSAKTIVLLTDGRPNMGPDPLAQAQACKDANVTIHTITFGNFCDTALMQQIADITEGDFYPAPDQATLQAAFEAIAKTVPVMTVE